MTARGDTEDARLDAKLLQFGEALRAYGGDIWDKRIALLEAAAAELSRLSDLVSGGNCIRGENGESQCETLAAELLRLQVADQGEDSGGSEAVSSGGSRLLYVSHDLSLSERRAVFVYEGARLQALAVDAPIVPELWPEREAPFRDQFVAYVDGLCNAEEFPTPEDAHDSWWRAYEEMGWVYGEVRDTELKTHPDMVPFSELEQREQDKDAVFLALVAIARDWIRA